MRLKIIFILTLVVVLGGQVIAQCCGSKQKMVQQITGSSFQMYFSRYEGTPFLTTEWRIADVKVLSGEMYKGLKVRLDLYKDDVVYYNEALKKLIVIDEKIIEEVRFYNADGTDGEVVSYYCNDKADDCKLFFIHYSDSISLWSEHQRKIEKYNDVSRSSSFLGGFYSVVKYYMVINNEFVHIPRRKRVLANMFPSNKKGIVLYISKNKLKQKNANDLVLIFKEINALEKKERSTYIEKNKLLFWK
ncbi:MAG: hypothetical protein PF517_22530 [Salinivirgaceae bacterium]|jgi:hypothetical protein|nr:hypothetical protein [Salinivirgaceae bacterium]